MVARKIVALLVGVQTSALPPIKEINVREFTLVKITKNNVPLVYNYNNIIKLGRKYSKTNDILSSGIG